LNCAVISTDAGLRARVTESLEDRRLGLKLTATVATPINVLGRDVVEDLRKTSVQLILLDLSDDPALGLRFARFLSDEIPSLTFVLIGPEVSPELLLEAMRVGAAEYLKTPVEDSDLVAALGRATRRLSGAAPTESHDPGHVYVVFSAKGGTGVTITAANLAVHLRNATHKNTLLLDLDLEMGSSALLLGLKPRYSFSDFVRNLHRMDRNLLESLVERHASGLDVLASPSQPNAGEGFTKEQVRSALQFLRRNYEHIVIDLARFVTPVTLATLERADEILLLTTPDLPTLRNTKKILPVVQRHAAEGSKKLRVVLNRHRSTDLILAKDVREALGMEVFCTLESDEENINRSVNEGTPVVLQAKSKYARDVKAMGAALGVATNGKGPARNSGGLFGLRLGSAKPEEKKK
jgi:pilus assembly protein CpaE